MEKRRLIIDCDPGHDDAIALILAFSKDIFDIAGVTVSAGNQTLDKTVQNAKNILDFIKADVPVAAGFSKPMLRELEIAPSVHGESGLDGPDLKKSEIPTHKLSAVEFIADVVKNSSKKITLVATGPLTNIGSFLAAYPELKNNIEEIVLMGGSIVGGNWSPAAEFNILVDPEAASIVYNSGIHVVMCGLDVTHKALMYPENIETIRELKSPVATLVAELLDFFIIFHKEQGFAGAPLHDPCTIAYLMKPEIFKTKELYVDIEVNGEYTTGATVADYYGVLKKEPNTTVVLDVKQEDIFDLIYTAMKEYKERGL